MSESTDRPEVVRCPDCGGLHLASEPCSHGASGAPWYVVIECSGDEPTEHVEDIVIGPFETEAAAREHMEDSADVEDWCTGEAKSSGYTVEDVYVTTEPEIPAYGVNAPVLGEEGDD